MNTILLSVGHHPEKRGASWKTDTETYDEFGVARYWVATIAHMINASGSNKAEMVPMGRLQDKVRYINEYNALTPHTSILAVELHFNSAGTSYVEGFETLHYPNSTRGIECAKRYNDKFASTSIARNLGKNRGIKEGWYRMDKPGVVDYAGDVDGDESIDYFLRKTSCTSLILEPGFMCQIPELINSGKWVDVCGAIAESLNYTVNG